MLIKHYNKAKPFASFLAGIAGLRGIPLWTFYVNRGQGICSFGINNKDNSITEFYPAHQSYQYVSSNGFRTFIKGNRCGNDFYYEPFTEFTRLPLDESMEIAHNQLSIRSINERDGLDVNVDYYNMPNESCAALVRRITIKNTLDTPVTLEVLDGLPFILPFGSDYGGFKNMGNTLKAWMDVFDVDTKIPIYRVRSSTADSAEVTEITSGHFYLSFSDGELLAPIVDARNIFGTNYALTFPDEFLSSDLRTVCSKEQVTANKVPSGFSPVSKTLQPGEVLPINTIIGFLPDINKADELKRFINTEYLDKKQAEATQIIDELLVNVETNTSNKTFDEYIKQCYLDNLLRGGFPLILGGKVYYVYSRKHGDLERDYNYFSLSAEYYSQGNGNFRDVNQNRRNDIYFNPKIGDYNVKAFFSFIQADGYNPLAIHGARFILDKSSINEINIDERMKGLLSKPFSPGKLITFMLENDLYSDEVFNKIFEKSSLILEADFGEGYWIDHFTYNIDLLNAYGEIFPDKLESLLFGDKDVLTFDSPAFIRPRSEKHVVKNGKVRQYNAIYETREKINSINERLQQTCYGKFLHNKDNSLLKMSLYEKMLLLAVTKFSLLDPMGMGLEMEANKPGWNDSLNGMPGLVGSGVSELIELKIIVDYLLAVDSGEGKTIRLPSELNELLIGLYNIDTQNNFEYWDKSASLREAYRDKIGYGFCGDEIEITTATVNSYLQKFAGKLNDGMEKCLKAGNGLYPTYFYYEATEYEEISGGKARVKAFKQHQLPYFLEGIARGLKIADKALAESIYGKVRESEVYDKKLKMYKTSEPLKGTTFEIGRGKAFTPGWLENESIFMHMEYKYLLSMLSAGLYDEFFEDMKNVMPVFLDPDVYGRSVLENSSFIASSANPDPSLHGNGFVARLSGSTAEMLSMWFRMFVGHAPFSYKENKLTLSFKPILQEWMFDNENKVSFKFLGVTDVTYHNQKRINTYVSDLHQKISVTGKDGNITGFTGFIDGETVFAVRDGLVSKIDIYFE